MLLLFWATRPARAGSLDDVVRRRDAAADGSCSFATWSGANRAKARVDEAMAPIDGRTVVFRESTRMQVS